MNEINLKKIYDDPLYIRNIENPTEEEMLVAVKKNGMVIKFLKNKSYEVKRESILNNPLSVEYIDNLEEDLAILAVKLLWNSIKYIKNITKNIMIEAVKTKGWAIQFLTEADDEIKLLSVEKDYDAIKYIKNPSEDVQLKAIESYWGAIRFIDKPTLEAKRRAIKINYEAINYISEYDLDELRIFIGDNINIVKYIYDSIDIDMVIQVVKEKIADEMVEEIYMKSFLELEIIEMDKINFVKEFGSKKAKKILVDYKLSE